MEDWIIITCAILGLLLFATLVTMIVIYYLIEAKEANNQKRNDAEKVKVSQEAYLARIVDKVSQPIESDDLTEQVAIESTIIAETTTSALPIHQPIDNVL